MLTIITGAPGSGKSACLVDFLTGIAQSGRQIFVDGVPELAISHETMGDARKWHLPVAEGGVPDGACIVIDEAQRVWRPRGSGSKVPDDIAMLETHRHRGLDFYIVTQHPSLIDANVRRLCGRHIHIRDLGILGRWWYEWPECGAPEQWKGAPIKKRYRLPKRVFGSYKSASLHIKPVRSIPPVLIVFGIASVCAIGVAVKAYGSVKGRIEQATESPRDVLAAAGATLPASSPQSSSVAVPGGKAPHPRVEVQADPLREPFGGRQLHLDGSWMQAGQMQASFGLSIDGARVATLSLRDLARAGYSFTSLAPCIGVLEYKGRQRTVLCDTPPTARPEHPDASVVAAVSVKP